LWGFISHGDLKTESALQGTHYRSNLTGKKFGILEKLGEQGWSHFFSEKGIIPHNQYRYSEIFPDVQIKRTFSLGIGQV